MKMILIKTATKRLRRTKEPLRIYRNQHGYVVTDLRHRFSESQVFPSSRAAVEAVLAGYRPTPTRVEA